MSPPLDLGDRLVDRIFWSRHSNPWSVWSLVLAYPTLILAIYGRNRPLLVGTLLFVVANPTLFQPPESDDAWATRVVLGEHIWVERSFRPLSVTLFAVASAPVYLFTLRSAVQRQPLRTAVGTLISMALMLLFFRRMERLYDEPGNRHVDGIDR